MTKADIDAGKLRFVPDENDTGYSGYVGIEYVWIDWEHCNECDNISETIQFRDLFKSLSAKE